MTLGLAAWVLLVFVVPDLGVAAAQSICDVPPGDRIELESRLAAIESIYEGLQAAKTGGPERDFSPVLRQIKEANSRLFDSYRPKLNRLIAMTRSIVRCSPEGALAFFVTESANTGISRDQNLKEAIGMFVDRNFDRLVEQQNPTEQFHFRPASLGEQLAGPALADAALLLCAPVIRPPNAGRQCRLLPRPNAARSGHRPWPHCRRR